MSQSTAMVPVHLLDSSHDADLTHLVRDHVMITKVAEECTSHTVSERHNERDVVGLQYNAKAVVSVRAQSRHLAKRAHTLWLRHTLLMRMRSARGRSAHTTTAPKVEMNASVNAPLCASTCT